LLALSWQTDLTRVATFLYGREKSVRTYPEIGVPESHHPISHHQKLADHLEKLAKINTYHVKLFAYFLEKLRATADGDGTLLDHALLVYGAGMSDSDTHFHHNLPVLLAGGGSGQVKGGRHLRFTNEPPLATVGLTTLDKLGLPADRLGDSDGRVRTLRRVRRVEVRTALRRLHQVTGSPAAGEGQTLEGISQMARRLVSMGILVCSLATGPVAAQAPAAAAKPNARRQAYVQPKTPDGQPDISGYWTNATYVPLERPKAVTKEFYTPEEMAKIERDARSAKVNRRCPARRATCYSGAQFGIGRSQATFANSLRTGLIVDPPDGRIPPQIPER
jgi:hypothetical protein